MSVKKFFSPVLCILLLLSCFAFSSSAVSSSSEPVIFRSFNNTFNADQITVGSKYTGYVLRELDGPLSFQSNPIRDGGSYVVYERYTSNSGSTFCDVLKGRGTTNANYASRWGADKVYIETAPTKESYRLVNNEWVPCEYDGPFVGVYGAGRPIVFTNNSLVMVNTDGVLLQNEGCILAETFETNILLNAGETISFYIRYGSDKIEAANAQIAIDNPLVASYSNEKITANTVGTTSMRVSFTNANGDRVDKTFTVTVNAADTGSDNSGDTPTSTNPFQKIIEFLRRIIDFFKNLFK